MARSGAVCKFLALICLLQLAGAVRKFNSLRVKYGLDVSEAFFEIPTSTSDPLIKDYVKVEPEADFKFPMDFYCYPDDPRVCFMYDRKGNPAGVQISLIKEDVSIVMPHYYNYTTYIETSFFGIPLYSQRTYFTNPETLTEEGRQNTEEIAEGLWNYLGGALQEIPREPPKTESFNGFYKQGCLLGMGQHYFYEVNQESTCNDKTPMFLLYSDEGLLGFGMANVGMGSHGPVRGWYEHPPKESILIIAPYSPGCMYELATMYGTTTVHVYLVDKPWEIQCPPLI